MKTNLGHTEAASGLVGIMKAVLALEKGIIPATLGVQHLNPNGEWPEAQDWSDTKKFKSTSLVLM